jgi:hypothetical protein
MLALLVDPRASIHERAEQLSGGQAGRYELVLRADVFGGHALPVGI